MTIAAINIQCWKGLTPGIIVRVGKRVPSHSATDWSRTINTPKAIKKKLKTTVNLLGGVHAILNH